MLSAGLEFCTGNFCFSRVLSKAPLRFSCSWLLGSHQTQEADPGARVVVSSEEYGAEIASLQDEGQHFPSCWAAASPRDACGNSPLRYLKIHWTEVGSELVGLVLGAARSFILQYP